MESWLKWSSVLRGGLAKSTQFHGCGPENALSEEALILHSASGMTECAAAKKIFDEAPEGELGDDLAGLHQVLKDAEKYFTERKTEMSETVLADLKSNLFTATFEDNAFMP